MLRCRMFRHGAHQVNSWSFSGSSARPHVDQAVGDDPFEQFALVRELADRVRLALLRMHVDVGARDVQVAAEDERRCRRRHVRGELLERREEPHLRGKVLAAVRHVHRRDGRRLRDGSTYDPVLVVERRMSKTRPFRRETLLTCSADARVALRSMPVAPVAFHLAEGCGHLVL